MPVDYTQPGKSLLKELESLNGIYIPGDTKDSFEDEQYLNAVRQIVQFVSDENLNDDKHFPLVAVSWGMLALLKTQTTQESLFRGLRKNLVGEPLQ